MVAGLGIVRGRFRPVCPFASAQTTAAFVKLLLEQAEQQAKIREGKKDEAAKLRRPLDFAEISFKFSLLGYAFDNVRTPFRCLHAKGFQCFPVRGSAICLGLLDAIKDVHYYPLRRLAFEGDNLSPADEIFSPDFCKAAAAFGPNSLNAAWSMISTSVMI